MKDVEAAAENHEARSTRELILDAAERLFAERGFAGVSMRDIVGDTSLKNQASLYHHFRNKQSLYEAVLGRGMDNLAALMPGAGSAGTAEQVAENLDRLLDYLADHPHLARLIQRAALDDSQYLQSAVRRLLRPLYTQGRQALSGADGIWKQDEMPHLAAGLYHLIFGYFANAALLDAVIIDDPLSPSAVDRQRRFLKTAVARLLGATPQRTDS